VAKLGPKTVALMQLTKGYSMEPRMSQALGELHQRNGFWAQFCHALRRQSHAGSLQTASDQLLAVEAIRCCI
jgi:hypothetical protein